MPFVPRNSDLQHFTFSLSQTTCHVHFRVHLHLVTQNKIIADILLPLGFVYEDSSALHAFFFFSSFIFFSANKVITEVFHNSERTVSESDAGKHSC